MRLSDKSSQTISNRARRKRIKPSISNGYSRIAMLRQNQPQVISFDATTVDAYIGDIPALLEAAGTELACLPCKHLPTHHR